MAGRKNKNNWTQRVFVETSALISVYNERDEKFGRSLETLDKMREERMVIVLTDYVLDETYTGILGNAGYQNAMEFDKDMRANIWRVEPINPKRFVEAQGIFRRFNKDKKWSFTDCTSYVVMKELKINRVFTYDKDFEQMGFEVL